MAKTALPKSDRRKPVSRKKEVAPVPVSDEAIAAKAFEVPTAPAAAGMAETSRTGSRLSGS